MINENEIRIGNWFHHTQQWSTMQGHDTLDFFDFKWTSSNWYQIGECLLSLEVLEPITLDEYWLLRFGFRLIERKGRYGNIYATSIPDIDFVVERDFNGHISYFFGIEYTDSPDPRDNHTSYNFSYNLRFVHQLQNLYFALVGEELVLQD
mgnify:CR=1 FL=1